MYSVKCCRSQTTQIGPSLTDFKCPSTQTSDYSLASYKRDERASKRISQTYDYLKEHILSNRDVLLEWLGKQQLMLPKNYVPPSRTDETPKVEDRSDGLKWECWRTINGKSHRTEASIRKDTWFEKSNMTIKEIVKFRYWWTTGMEQHQIMQQLSTASTTGVDWDSFCREVCEITLMHDSCKIVGPGKMVQIDESRDGKPKYHHGHRVEGQRVFGGIEQDSRKCFILTVEDRSEANSFQLIKNGLLQELLLFQIAGNPILSNPQMHGYTHETVNHSKEFVNKNGKHTNKIEGQWRHLKTGLPEFGRRKYMTVFRTYCRIYVALFT